MQQEAMVVQLTPAMCPPFAENEKNEEKKNEKDKEKNTNRDVGAFYTRNVSFFCWEWEKTKKEKGKGLTKKKIPSEMEVAPRYNCWHCWHDTVDAVDAVDMVYTVDTVDTVDMVYTVDMTHNE